MTSATDRIHIHGHDMELLIGKPPGAGPFPGVLVMFHRGGFDGFTRGRVSALSEAGYLAVAPDFYHRCPGGTKAEDCKQYLTDAEVLAEIRASADYLAARPDVIRDRLFILGHCMGGRMAYMGAATVPLFRGCVVFYGGGMFVPWGEGKEIPFDLLGDIKCPIIGFFGNDDVNPSPEHVNRIDARLTEAGVDHVFHRYPGVGHGFQNPSHDFPAYRAASEDAWGKTLAFMANA